LLLRVEPTTQRASPLNFSRGIGRRGIEVVRAFHDRPRPCAKQRERKHEERTMRSESAWLPLGVLGFFAVGAASMADAATVTGTVTGPDGAPLRAVFVQARNAKTKI